MEGESREGRGRTGAKVEKCHAENGRDEGAGEENGAEEGDCLHGCAVALTRVGETALLTGHLELNLRLALRKEIVKLHHVSKPFHPTHGYANLPHSSEYAASPTS